MASSTLVLILNLGLWLIGARDRVPPGNSRRCWEQAPSGRQAQSEFNMLDCDEPTPYFRTLEGSAHALAGMAGFLLLPLFHFQLFFFLLESMGGNTFVLCLGWVLVPSVVTRVPLLRDFAARHLRALQATVGCLFAGSLAAGAAGLLTARLVISAAGLSAFLGGCQVPHLGGAQGSKIMHGLVAGNHLALILQLGAGVLSPPSPQLRFLWSLPLPALLLLELWASPSGRLFQRRARPLGGRRAWAYLRLFDADADATGVEGGNGKKKGKKSGAAGGGRQQRRHIRELDPDHDGRRDGHLSGRENGSDAARRGAAHAAPPRAGGGGGVRAHGGGRGEGLELSASRGTRAGEMSCPHQASTVPWTSPRTAAPKASVAVLRTPAADGAPALGEVPVAREASPSTRSRVAAAIEGMPAAATATTGSTRTAFLRQESWTEDDLPPHPAGVSFKPSACHGFLEGSVASAGFGGLFFLTVLLVGSPWTGDEWAPSPGLGAGWAALRGASAVLAWGLGRAASVSLASAAVVPRAGGEGGGVGPRAEEDADGDGQPAVRRGGEGCAAGEEEKEEKEDEGINLLAATTSSSSSSFSPSSSCPSSRSFAAVSDYTSEVAATAGGEGAGEGGRPGVRGNVRSDPGTGRGAEEATAAMVTGATAAAGAASQAEGHASEAGDEEARTTGRIGSGRDVNARRVVVVPAAAASDVSRAENLEVAPAAAAAAAGLTMAGVSAIALRPENPLAIVPGILAVAFALPTLWRHLGVFCSEGTGNDGAAVYLLLAVWETALVAFEYAPPLRPLRGTRPALLVVAGLLAAAPSFASAGAWLRERGQRNYRERQQVWGAVGSGGVDGGSGSSGGDVWGGCGVCGGVGVSGGGVGVGVGGSGGSGGSECIDGGHAGSDVVCWSVGCTRRSTAAATTATTAARRSRRRRCLSLSEARVGGEGGRYDRCFTLLASPSAAAVVTVIITLILALGAPSILEAAVDREGGAKCPTAEAAEAAEGKWSSRLWSTSPKALTRSSKVRLVNFNVYMGYDRRGEDNTFRVADLLRQLKADVAALQETGLMRLTLGNRYYTRAVARAAGMVVAAAAPVAEDTWGCTILSRLPVLSWGWRRLPRGPGENACETHATLSLGRGRGVMTVVNVHLGNEGDTDKQVTGLLSLLQDLRRQDLREKALFLRRSQKSPRHPRRQDLLVRQKLDQAGADRTLLIVVGDFNFVSSSSGYSRLVSEAGLRSAAKNCSSAEAAAAAAEVDSHTSSISFISATAAAVAARSAVGTASSRAVADGKGVMPRRWRQLRGAGAAGAANDEGDGDGDGGYGANGEGGGDFGSSGGGDGGAESDSGVGHGVDNSGGLIDGVVRGDGVGYDTGDGADESDAQYGAIDSDAEDGALDFVFFATGDDDGVSCGSYEVHREFSQQRFADGYPSVTEFDLSCPLQRLL